MDEAFTRILQTARLTAAMWLIANGDSFNQFARELEYSDQAHFTPWGQKSLGNKSLRQ